MKVKTKDYNQEKTLVLNAYNLRNLIREQLYDTGTLEVIEGEQSNIFQSLSSLVIILLEKGILDLDDLNRVIHRPIVTELIKDD